MTSFLNPFHFVPLGTTVNGLPVTEFAEFVSGKDVQSANHLRHDRYVSGTAGTESFSGRLICSLTAVGPFVGGGSGAGQREEKDGSGIVPPFQINNAPAIPASSLRGLISSLAEALSNSTLRVLDNRHYSVRSRIKEQKHHRSMIGMVVSKDGQRFIRPLTFPAVKSRANGGTTETYPIPPVIRSLAGVLQLPCYLDGYQPDSGFLQWLQTEVDDGRLTWQTVRESFWSLSRRAIASRTNSSISVSTGGFRRDSRTRDFVLGILPTTNPAMPTIVTKEQTGVNQDRGILRILGKHNPYREAHLPNTKKHELFIPVPDLVYFQTGKSRGDCFDLPAETVLRQFEDLALLSTMNSENTPGAELPFELAGQARTGAVVDASNDRKIPTIRLQVGDLVYFRVAENGVDELPKVTSVAIASVWREDAGWTHDYFSNNVNADLVPFDAAPDKRTKITVAEQLFGFIAENAAAATRQADAGQPPETVIPIRGLASRLRFSDARLSQSLSSHDTNGGHYQAQVRLKILSSPKAPCPVLYFCRNQGGGVSKLDMTREDRRDIRPMGRKFYLHHPKHEFLKTTNPPWQSSTTENNNQKVWVTPVKPGAAFVFHVDFNNLTETELGLLCRSLQPSDGFHHKLGMGKPLGLGTVKIQPLGLFLIDRKKRYESDDVFSATARRYHSRAIFAQQEWETAKAMYPTEAADQIPVDGASFQTRCDAFTPDPVIDHAVRLLGTIPVTETADGNISYPQISYPLVNEATRAAEQEQKHYEWFVANDANNPQSLKPIDQQATKLPVLDRLPRPRIH